MKKLTKMSIVELNILKQYVEEILKTFQEDYNEVKATLTDTEQDNRERNSWENLILEMEENRKIINARMTEIMYYALDNRPGLLRSISRWLKTIGLQ